MEPITIKSAEITLLEKGIIQIITARNHETTIADVDEINEITQRLAENQRHYILVLTTQGSGSTEEAKEYAARESFRKHVIAQAIVISNVAIRLAATVYMKVNRPKQKIRLFNSKEKALQWIRSEMKKHR